MKGWMVDGNSVWSKFETLGSLTLQKLEEVEGKFFNLLLEPVFEVSRKLPNEEKHTIT